MSQQLKRQRQEQEAIDSNAQPHISDTSSAPTSSSSSSSPPSSSLSSSSSWVQPAVGRSLIAPFPPLITSSPHDTYAASPHISNIVNNVVNNAVVTNHILVNAVNNVQPLYIKPNTTKTTANKAKKSTTAKASTTKSAATKSGASKPKVVKPVSSVAPTDTSASAPQENQSGSPVETQSGKAGKKPARLLIGDGVGTAPPGNTPRKRRAKVNKKKDSGEKAVATVWPSAFTPTTFLPIVTSPDVSIQLSPPVNDLVARAASLSTLPAKQQLDPEAINFIHRIYCRECQKMEEDKQQQQHPGEQTAGVSELTSTGDSSSPSSSMSPPASCPAPLAPNSPISPLTSVEEQSLQQAMDINKESLKRKLLMRRSVSELREQGIYPPLKTPPAFAEQSKHLERAKTGDILSKKLQQRPDRRSLVQHHILEDSNASPSIQERQRMLKRARLQDSLSNSLAHRPGPLDLVQGNIIPVDSQLRNAINDGQIPFVTAEDDSSEDEGDVSSDGGVSSPGNNTVTESSDGCSLPSTSPSPSLIPMPPDITPLLQRLGQSPITLPGSTSPHNFNFSQQKTPVTFTGSSGIPSSNSSGSLSGPRSGSFSSGCSGSSGKNNLNRIKKNKNKASAKSKVIKFHEYKGPSSASKIAPTSPSPTPSPSTELTMDHQTAYNILLQQQQLFLQLQLESQQKNLPLTTQQLCAAAQQSSSLTSPGASGPTGQVTASVSPLTSPTRFVANPVSGSLIKAPVAVSGQAMSVQQMVVTSPAGQPTTKPLALGGQPIMISSINGQPMTIGGRPVTFTQQPVSLRTKSVTATTPPAPVMAKEAPASMVKAPVVMSPVVNSLGQPKGVMNAIVKVEPKSVSEGKNEGMLVDDMMRQALIAAPTMTAIPPPPPPPPIPHSAMTKQDIKPTIALVSPPDIESVQVVLTAGNNKATAPTIALTPTATSGKCVTMTSGSTAASIAVPPGFKIVKLEEMKVNELKAELKKRNLTVSGPKPNLIERLKPHLGGDTLLISTAKPPSKAINPPKVGKITGVANQVVAGMPPSVAPSELGDDAMNLGSPPMSPQTSPLQPTSPCEMDVMSPPNSAVLAGEDKTEVAMELKQPSRPASAMPMDVDLNQDMLGIVPQKGVTCTKTVSQPGQSSTQVITIQPQSNAGITTLSGSVYTTLPSMCNGMQVLPSQITLRPPVQVARISQASTLPKNQRTFVAMAKPQQAVVAKPQQVVLAKPQQAVVAKPQQTAIVKPQKQNVEVQPEPPDGKTPLCRVQAQSPAKTHVSLTPVSSTSIMGVQTPVVSVAPVGQPQVMSHEELLSQQRQQIAQLVNQLHMSQRELIDKEHALQEKTTELVAAQRVYTEQEKLRIQWAQLQALSAAQGLNAQLLVNPPAFTQFRILNTPAGDTAGTPSSATLPVLPEVKTEPSSEPTPMLQFTSSLPNHPSQPFILTPKLPSNHLLVSPSSSTTSSHTTVNSPALPTAQNSLLAPHTTTPSPQTPLLTSQPGIVISSTGGPPVKTVPHSLTGVVSSSPGLISQAGVVTIQQGGTPTQPAMMNIQQCMMSNQTSVATSQAGVVAIPPGQMAIQPGMLSGHPAIMNSHANVMTSQSGVLFSMPAGLMASQAGMMSSQTGVMSSQTGVLSSQAGVLSSQADVVSSQAGVMSSQSSAMVSQAGVMASQLGVTVSHSGMMMMASSGVTTAGSSSQPAVFASSSSPFASPSAPPIVCTRSSSVPGSPVPDDTEAQMSQLHRSATTPGLHTSIDLPNSLNTSSFKAPPNYQEAVKNKQNLLQTHTDNLISLATKNNSILKSSVMDDVLEILIRSGELPPDAAQEPPPAPKSTANHTLPTSHVTTTCGKNKTVSVTSNGLGTVMGGDYVIVPNGVLTSLESSGTTPTCVAAVTATVQQQQPGTSPSPLPSALVPNTDFAQNTASPDLSYIDQLSSSFSPFIAMDWDDDGNLSENFLEPSQTHVCASSMKDVKPEQADSVDLSNMDFLSSHSDLTSDPGLSTPRPENSLGDIGLNMLGISDCDLSEDANGITMDWLDAIMPQTSQTPSVSTTTTPSFSSDPILTPKPLDVLDLFNMDESDLYLPSELGVGSFEKAMETAASSSS